MGGTLHSASHSTCAIPPVWETLILRVIAFPVWETLFYAPWQKIFILLVINFPGHLLGGISWFKEIERDLTNRALVREFPDIRCRPDGIAPQVARLPALREVSNLAFNRIGPTAWDYWNKRAKRRLWGRSPTATGGAAVRAVKSLVAGVSWCPVFRPLKMKFIPPVMWKNLILQVNDRLQETPSGDQVSFECGKVPF